MTISQLLMKMMRIFQPAWVKFDRLNTSCVTPARCALRRLSKKKKIVPRNVIYDCNRQMPFSFRFPVPMRPSFNLAGYIASIASAISGRLQLEPQFPAWPLAALASFHCSTAASPTNSIKMNHATGEFQMPEIYKTTFLNIGTFWWYRTIH